MVLSERLPTPLPAAPEGLASRAPAAGVVAAAKVAWAEFTAVPKRRSFSAKYKLRILAETDRAGEQTAPWNRPGRGDRRHFGHSAAGGSVFISLERLARAA